MNDLPQITNTNDQPTIQPPTFSFNGKEGEIIPAMESPLKGVGQEIQLPKEIESVGVKVTPQTVPLPPQLQQAGVQAVGANVPVPVHHAPAIQLPLTDEQIAKALKESIKHSIRWLAEWCVRKVKVVHAKVIRKDAHHS